MNSLKGTNGTPKPSSNVNCIGTRDRLRGASPTNGLWRRSTRSTPSAGLTAGANRTKRARRCGEGVQASNGCQRCEVCVMQKIEHILDIYQKRGAQSLPLERVYRQLFHPDFYLLAYSKLYANDRAMTPGSEGESVDGAPFAGFTYPSERAEPARSDFPIGATRLSRKSCGRFFRRTTSRSSRSIRTGSARTGAVKQPCGKSTADGQGPLGSSKGTSKDASTTSTTMFCSTSSNETSTITDCFASSEGCSARGTWRTGSGTRPKVGRRKAGSSVRCWPTSISMRWIGSSKTRSSRPTRRGGSDDKTWSGTGSP